MFNILIISFFLLLLLIGGDRGVISAITIVGNIAVFIFAVLLMSQGLSPIIITFLSSIVIALITIFYQNGKSEKTIAAFISVVIVILILFFIIYIFGESSVSGGLNEIEKYSDELFYYSTDININMRSVAHSVVVFGLLGAIIDLAIAISSSISEVFSHKPSLSVSELTFSGMKIGKDILGSTINTLIFAFVGESLMLFVFYQNYAYSFSDIINSKSFFQEFECILFSCIGCVMIVPLTALIASNMIKKRITELKQ